MMASQQINSDTRSISSADCVGGAVAAGDSVGSVPSSVLKKILLVRLIEVVGTKRSKVNGYLGKRGVGRARFRSRFRPESRLFHPWGGRCERCVRSGARSGGRGLDRGGIPVPGARQMSLPTRDRTENIADTFARACRDGTDVIGGLMRDRIFAC